MLEHTSGANGIPVSGVGRVASDRLVQMIVIVDGADLICIVHARPVTGRERKRRRKRARP
jgi:hypothetical protein